MVFKIVYFFKQLVLFFFVNFYIFNTLISIIYNIHQQLKVCTGN